MDLIPAQTLQANSVPGAIFSHLMLGMDLYHFHNFTGGPEIKFTYLHCFSWKNDPLTVKNELKKKNQNSLWYTG